MNAFSVGVGVRDITPEPGLPLWGYSDRASNATGTLDELYARAIVFASETRRVAWVTLDLGRVPLKDDCDSIRARCSGLKLDAIAFHATHTHHAPAMETIGDPHRDTMLGLIAESIQDAAADREPARIGVGQCEIDIAHNRRFITEDGRCLMRWRNVEQVPTEPVDRQITVIKIETAEGKPKAILAHYACHPVIMGPSNVEYSADYIGALCRIVKGMTDAECFFLQGACADINPYADKTSIDEGGIDAAFSAGRIAAEAVIAAALGIETRIPKKPSVEYHETSVDVGVRWNLTDPNECRALQQSHPGLFERYMKKLGTELRLPLTVVTLNRDIALVGMPGEIFVEQQIAMKKDAPLPHALLCGYVNEYHAYLPPIRHAAAGGYGGSVGTYAGVGAAEKLYNEALIALHRQNGRCTGIPTQEDFTLTEIGPDSAQPGVPE